MEPDLELGLPEVQAPEELAEPSEPSEEPAPETETVSAPELETVFEPESDDGLAAPEVDVPPMEFAPAESHEEAAHPEKPELTDLPDFVEETPAPAADDLDVALIDDTALDFAQDLPASAPETPETPEPALEFSRASADDAPEDAGEPEVEAPAPAPEVPQDIRSISDLVLPDAADIPEAGKSFADDLDLAKQDAEQVGAAEEPDASAAPADLTLDLDLGNDLGEEGDAFALPDASLDTTPEQIDEPEALVLEPAGLDEKSDALDTQLGTEAPSEMLDLPVAEAPESEADFDTLDAELAPQSVDTTEETESENSSDTEVLSILAALKDPELDAVQNSETEQPRESAEPVSEGNAPELDIQNLDLPSENEEESPSEAPLPDSEPAEMPATDAPIVDSIDAAMDLPETDLDLPDVETPVAPEPAIAESDVEEIDETEDTTTPASTDPDDSDTAFEVKTARHHLVGGKEFTPEERATIRELSERLTTLRKTYGNPVKAPQEN
jgi:pilus assembly protein FimV